MVGTALVHFNGLFSTDEKRQIQEGVAAAERALPSSLPAPAYGKPWVVVKQTLTEGRDILVAHRLGTPRSVVSYSTSELLTKLSTVTEENPASSSPPAL